MRPGAIALMVWTLGLGAARASGHPGALPGEAFTFKFFVDDIETGRARMSVGLPTTGKGGRRLVAIHGQAETSKWLRIITRLDDDYKLTLDAATMQPVEVVSIERGYRERTLVTNVDGRVVNLQLTSPKQNGVSRKILPAIIHDPLSALFAVRAAALGEGDALQLMILDGLALWKTRLTVKRAPFYPRSGLPPRPAIRLDGVNTRIDESGGPNGLVRHFVVWLSDDPDRVLLRMEADTDLGRAAIELTSYLKPQQRGPAPATLPGLQQAR